MYHQHFGLSATPFSAGIATRDLYPSRSHQEARARLTYLLRERGIGVLTGNFGSGKSTAVRAFSEGLDPSRYQTFYFPNPTMGSSGLYREMVTALGGEPSPFRRYMVPFIRQKLEELFHERRRTCLLVIDEAHVLKPQVLDELRLLLNFKMDSESPSALVLIGHTDLRKHLYLAANEAFAQRVLIHCHMAPLDLEETAGYIKHQVKVAGYAGPQLFSDDFVAKAFDYTKGNPRQINRVCSHALMAAFAEQKQIVDESPLRQVIHELEGERLV